MFASGVKPAHSSPGNTVCCPMNPGATTPSAASLTWKFTDVVETTERRIRESGVMTTDEVRRQSVPLVQYSPELKKLNLELRRYLYKNLYYNPVVHLPNKRAVGMLADLFQHFLKHPADMGEQARKRIRTAGRHRAICDYLAGMTDRYAMLEHQRIFRRVSAKSP